MADVRGMGSCGAPGSVNKYHYDWIVTGFMAPVKGMGPCGDPGPSIIFLIYKYNINKLVSRYYNGNTNMSNANTPLPYKIDTLA